MVGERRASSMSFTNSGDVFVSFSTSSSEVTFSHHISKFVACLALCFFKVSFLSITFFLYVLLYHEARRPVTIAAMQEDNPVDTPRERAERLRELTVLWDKYREVDNPVSAAFILAEFSNLMAHLTWQIEYEDEMVASTDTNPGHRYHVVWSPEDGEFVATVDEYPSLSWLAPTAVEALHGLIGLVVGLEDDYQ